MIIPDEYIQLYSLPTNVAKSEHIKDLLDRQKDLFDLKLAPKLEEKYLDRSGHFQKMRLKSATHVLSHDVSSALNFLADEESKVEYETTSWLVDNCSKWYKIISARNLTFALSKKNENKFRETVQFLQEFIDLISKINFGNKKQFKPFQKGIILTTKSFIELATYLITKRNYKFVFGGRFTQDCVENLFSVLRMKNCILNAVQFKNNLKLITISYYMRQVSNGCYNEDDREFLPDFLGMIHNLKKNKQSNETNAIKIPDVPYELDILIHGITLSNVEINILHNIAGYLIKSIIKNEKCCKQCVSSTGSLKRTFTTYSKFSYYKSYGNDMLFLLTKGHYTFLKKWKKFSDQ